MEERRVGMVHGYGLTGSGSNLWTGSVARSLCRDGAEVHLVCQESRPEALDFVAEAWTYGADGSPSRLFRREVDHPGRCIVHRPELDVLPTYVRPQSPSGYVVAIRDLDPDRIEEYLRRNEAALARVAEEWRLSAFHVNHVLLLAEALRRLKSRRGIRYAVMPHGSAMEYVVRKIPAMRDLAAAALAEADLLLLLNEDIRRRLRETFPDLTRVDERARTVRAGVDTARFRVVPRAERAAGLARVMEALSGEERGKHAGRTRRFLDELDALEPHQDSDATRTGPDPDAAQAGRGPDSSKAEPDTSRAGPDDPRADAGPDAVKPLLERAADYPRSHPDADLEERLSSVRWGEDPVVLFVGRLIPQKGVPSLVTAFPDVLARHPEARLVLVGSGVLREILEGLVHALGTGRRALARRIVEHGDEWTSESVESFEPSRRHLDLLERDGDLDAWFERARRLDLERVLFTGFLGHDVLRHLFPLADVAVFPSAVTEGSPLVVAEAAASGCFPMGTDFAGMRHTLDAVARGLEPDLRPLLRIRPEPEHVVSDIAGNVSSVLERRGDYEEDLHGVAVGHFDWVAIARALRGALEEIRAGSPRPGSGD